MRRSRVPWTRSVGLLMRPPSVTEKGIHHLLSVSKRNENDSGSVRVYASKTAKHLFELKRWDSMNVDHVGLRFSSLIAPARQNQLSISCWPEASTADRE